MYVFVFFVDFIKLQMSTLSIRVLINWISIFIRIFIISFSLFRRWWFFKRRRQRFQFSKFWSFVKYIRNIISCERNVDRNKIEKIQSWQNWFMHEYFKSIFWNCRCWLCRYFWWYCCYKRRRNSIFRTHKNIIKFNFFWIFVMIIDD